MHGWHVPTLPPPKLQNSDCPQGSDDEQLLCQVAGNAGHVLVLAEHAFASRHSQMTYGDYGHREAHELPRGARRNTDTSKKGPSGSAAEGRYQSFSSWLREKGNSKLAASILRSASKDVGGRLEPELDVWEFEGKNFSWGAVPTVELPLSSWGSHDATTCGIRNRR